MITDDLKIAPHHLHTLRRSFVVRMVKAGMDLRTIQCILGYRDLSTLWRLYGCVAADGQ